MISGDAGHARMSLRKAKAMLGWEPRHAGGIVVARKGAVSG